MSRPIRRFGCGLVASLEAASIVNAGVWPSPRVGSSDPAADIDDSDRNTTNYPAQGTGDRTRGVQFALSMLGWHDVVAFWDQYHGRGSARHAQFQYSTDGELSFIDHGGLFVANAGDTWFNGRTLSLAGITGVDNNPSFAFRIVSAIDPDGTGYVTSNPTVPYDTTSAWRFDMGSVSAVPEPEACALLLAGLGLLGVVARRRRA